MNDYISNHNDQRPKHKTWTRDDNQLALHSAILGATLHEEGIGKE